MEPWCIQPSLHHNWIPLDQEHLTNACEIQPVAPLLLPDSPAFEQLRAQSCVTAAADWVSRSWDRSAFSLTAGFEIPGLKVLRDYISEGMCDDGSWQLWFSNGWEKDSSGWVRLSELQWNGFDRTRGSWTELAFLGAASDRLVFPQHWVDNISSFTTVSVQCNIFYCSTELLYSSTKLYLWLCMGVEVIFYN